MIRVLALRSHEVGGERARISNDSVAVGARVGLSHDGRYRHTHESRGVVFEAMTDEHLLIRCYICRVDQPAAVRGQVEVSIPDIGWESSLVSLVQCLECGDVMLFQQKACGAPATTTWSQPERLWPWEEGFLSESIPESIRRQVVEARACLEANAYTACVVMVRRTLEGVAKHKNAQGRSLAESLRRLRENQTIDGQLVEWASALRVLGNQGAHFSEDDVTLEDAQDALALAETLLEHVYVWSERFTRFRNRRTPNARPTLPPVQ